MKTRALVFIGGFIVWALLCWPCDIRDAIAGVFVSALAAFIANDLFAGRQSHMADFRRYPWFIAYLSLFFWEWIKADIDAVFKIVGPNLPKNPGIVKVKTTLKSDTALTFLANSITLSPGMLCVDIAPDKGILYIHCFNTGLSGDGKPAELIVRKFEKVLERIFER